MSTGTVEVAGRIRYDTVLTAVDTVLTRCGQPPRSPLAHELAAAVLAAAAREHRCPHDLHFLHLSTRVRTVLDRRGICCIAELRAAPLVEERRGRPDPLLYARDMGRKGLQEILDALVIFGRPHPEDGDARDRARLPPAPIA